MRWRALLVALVTSGVLTAVACDQPRLRLEPAVMSHAAAVSVRSAARQLRAVETRPELTWSDILPSEPDDEPGDAWDEPAGTVYAPANDADLEALTQLWTDALEGGAVLSDQEPTLQTAVLEEGAIGEGDDAEGDEGGEVDDDEGVADDVAEEVEVAEEEAIDPLLLEEELARLDARVLELEAQVQQQRADLDTMALAMAIQARRVTILDNAVSQLVLVCGR